MSGGLGLSPDIHPDLVGVVWLGRLFLVACAPMLLALWQGLRLNYWRPWAPPETWETGDERNARWAMQLAHKASSPPSAKVQTGDRLGPPRRRL